FLPESALGPRNISKTNSRRKVQMASGSECLWNARIACDQQPRRRAREQCRLFSRNVGLQLVILLPERRDHVPAQTSIDRKIVAHSPAILSIEAEIAIPQVE